MSEVFLPVCGGHYCIIDEADYPLVARARLSVMTGRYVRVQIRRRGQVLLHRLLTGAVRGQFVDHINGDGFDNRRSNLRLCTPKQNAGNRRVAAISKTGLKGVSPFRNKYRAQIKNGDETIYLGVFDAAEEAALAYDAKALELHGDFARLNFPRDDEEFRRASA